jgi:hypothetical protein
MAPAVATARHVEFRRVGRELELVPRDDRRHPRRLRRSAPLRERKLTLPTDLPDRALCVDRAAPVRNGKLRGRSPSCLKRADHDYAEGDKAYTNDEIPDH